MSGAGTYVCAFAGRRDYYQLPLALSEAGLLDSFITDAYYGGLARWSARFMPEHLARKMQFRFDAGLRQDRIICLWRNVIEGRVRERLGFADWHTFATLDRRLSIAAAARARRNRCHLFLYQPYAWEAFTAKYAHEPRKILFQFHPHADLERRILREDAERHPVFRHSYEEEMGDHVSQAVKQRNRDCWRHADLILCASEFTKYSLVEAGADPKICKRVAYGIDLPDLPLETRSNESFHVLFVGSGTQRKGLHHLLMAWRMAALPPDSRLTLVCRAIDPGLESMLRTVPKVRLLRGVDAATLEQMFRTGTLFAMPSLVEGFGQVYLEALAQGCPVLGTPNSCLPDLGPSDAVHMVQAGAIDELTARLEQLARMLPGDIRFRKEARACAARWPWTQFRHGVISALRLPISSRHSYLGDGSALAHSA